MNYLYYNFIGNFIVVYCSEKQILETVVGNLSYTFRDMEVLVNNNDYVLIGKF